MRDAFPVGMKNPTTYERFKLERDYHSAMFTMLHEIEQSILRDYSCAMDDDYLRQTVVTATRLALLRHGCR